MKTVILVICVGLLVIDLAGSAGHDFPKITGNDPVDLSESQEGELTCHVENLNQSIAWIYNDAIFFSCDFPYSVGMCVNLPGYPYSFTINQAQNTFVMKFEITENVNDGNWTCRHGNDTSHPYDIDTGIPPAMPNLTISNMNPVEGENITLTCTAPESNFKLTKFEMRTWDGVNRVYLYNIQDPANLTYTYTYTVSCSTIRYYCVLFNRFGNSYVSHRITTDCPIEFRKDLTPTNVTAMEGDRWIELMFYYTGKLFPPEFQWYKLDNGVEKNLTDYRNQPLARKQCKPTGTECVLLIIYRPIVADSGYYVVYANETKTGSIQSHTFHLNVMPQKSVLPTGTTVSPTEKMPCSAPSSDELTFGQGIGIGIGIGIGVIIFVVGGIYGCRKA